MMAEQDPYPMQSNSGSRQGLSGESSGLTPGAIWIEALIHIARRKWIIAKVAGLWMLAGIIFCLVTPAQYTGTVMIMPPRQSQSSAALMMSQLASSSAASLATAGGTGLSLRNPNDIYIGLLNSRPVADAIIRKFGLSSVYHTKDMTASRKVLAAHTTIKSEKSSFISVSVTDRDKKRVADMANTYVEQLRALTKTLAVTEASERRLFYEEQLKYANEDLVVAEHALQEIQQRKGLVQLDAQAKALIAGLADLQAQVAVKRVQLQSLRSYSTEQNPEVELVENQLSSLQDQASRLEQSSHSSEPANRDLQDVAKGGMEYLRAEHELQYRQSLVDLLIKQFEAAKLDEAKDAAIIQVVEPAIEPDRKSSPKRMMIMLLCTFLGFIIGCFLALFIWWKERLQSDLYCVHLFNQLRNELMGKELETQVS
jgi:uncharacterized protein involved in exopolysaccharide biosynthesis